MQELREILGFMKELSGLIIAAMVFVLLLIFKSEVRKLVDWVVILKKISKTRDGYAVEAGREPEQLPELQETKEERKITELQETVPTSDKEVPKATVDEGRTWLSAFHNKEYDEAIRLLEVQVEQTTDQTKQSLSSKVTSGLY